MRPLVAIPTKDNVETVAEVARRCLDICPDVLVIDDGSTDGSGDAAEAVTTVVRHPHNRGKGAAIVTALRWAAEHGFTHLVTVDADGQHLPEDLPLFLDAARADPWAIHLGVREMSTAPESSRFGRNFSNFWIWVETGHQVGDSQTGFRVYPVQPVLSLRLPKGRYEWEVEVLTRALWAGVAVRDVACRVHYPPEEERVSSFRPLWDNLRISWANTRLVTGRILWPPRWHNPVASPGGAWQGRTRGGLAGWRFLTRLIRLLGRWPMYGCMFFMASFYVLAASEQRRGLMAYLRRIDPAAGALTLWARSWRGFFSFACSIVDRFAVFVRGPAQFHFERENTRAAREAIESGEGAIVLTAHMGNPDLGASLLQDRNGPRLSVYMLQYHDRQDPYVQLMTELMGERAPRIIALNTDDQLASLEVVRALREGGVVAMKMDRLVDQRVVEASFLGETLRLPAGPLLLAALAEVPVVMLGCFKEGPSAYRIIASDPRTLRFTGRGPQREEDLAAWAGELTQVLEGWAKRWPRQWYNFHDPWSQVDRLDVPLPSVTTSVRQTASP
jgi:predicted LPLAT superfamily acyltransferase